MLMIRSQDKKSFYSIEGADLFICENNILITKGTNIYKGDCGCLGKYKDEKEAIEIMEILISKVEGIKNINERFYCINMP